MSMVEKEILKKIKSGKIQMKPRWRFVARIWEERTMWLILILATALSISEIVYFVEIYNPVELAEFGEIGRQVILEDFPYYWLFGAIIFLFLAVRLLLRLGENYRKTTRLMMVITISAVLLVAGIMFLARKFLL